MIKKESDRDSDRLIGFIETKAETKRNRRARVSKRERGRKKRDLL